MPENQGLLPQARMGEGSWGDRNDKIPHKGGKEGGEGRETGAWKGLEVLPPHNKLLPLFLRPRGPCGFHAPHPRQPSSLQTRT